jgi:hypothetical protein
MLPNPLLTTLTTEVSMTANSVVLACVAAAHFISPTDFGSEQVVMGKD